jgi:hypothetical protein
MEERPFHTARLARRLPGQLGPSADLYLQSLKLEGKTGGTRYEYHRELEILGERHPDTDPGRFTPLDIQSHLAERCEGLGRPGVSARPLGHNSRRKVYAVLAGYFGWLHDQGAITQIPCGGSNVRPHLSLSRRTGRRMRFLAAEWDAERCVHCVKRPDA